MNTARIQHLRNIMVNVRDAHRPFDLGTFIDKYSRMEEGGYSSGLTGDLHQTCGTTCCAMGYAALDPHFQAEGLSMFAIPRDFPSPEREELPTIEAFNAHLKNNPGDYRFHYIPLLKDWNRRYYYDAGDGFQAAMEFFDISSDAADYLFQPETYSRNEDEDGNPGPITPDDVIARIDEMLNGTYED